MNHTYTSYPTLPPVKNYNTHQCKLATDPINHDKDDETIVTSNCTNDSSTAASLSANGTEYNSSEPYSTENPPINIAFAAQHAAIDPKIELGVADSGTTGHFCMKNAKVKNIRPATKPVTITILNGESIVSTHVCNLDISWLPDNLTEAHIVPDLAHSTLISIKKFCDGGCRVIFDDCECRVYHNGQLVLQGAREAHTNLWTLPINPTTQPTRTMDKYDLAMLADSKPIQHHEVAYNAYTMPTAQARVKYLHQCLFSPPQPTLLSAIKNKQLESWPGLTTAAVKKYLAASPATSKGHMKRPRKGIRTTTTKPQLSKRNLKRIQEIVEANIKN